MSLIVGGFASSALPQTAPPDRPNVIIILADDLGYGDVSFNGCPDYVTPNIDSLGANGVWCSSGYVTHPFCSPSRAGLITGRYQQRFGHENNPQDDTTNPKLGLPMQELLLPQILKPAGYVCGIVGKWHLGEAPNLRPTQRGFDEFFGFLSCCSKYFNASVLRNGTPLVEPDYLTDAFTREAVSFINRHATEPFFLFLTYNAPHTPYNVPPQSYMDRVANITDPDRRVYAAMITALDDGVGQVLQTLQTQNLLDKTLIFFLSDNGAQNETFSRNFPLRGYKGSVWEGGIRVPFAVQWTGRLPAGVAYDQPVSALDIVPTVAAAAGISLPADRIYDGINVIPYLAREQIASPRTLFWRWFGLGPTGPPGSQATACAVRNGSLKLVQQGVPNPQLYDLSIDISEGQNLAQSRPGDLASLKQLYAQWDAQMIEPLWPSADPYHPPLASMVLAGDWNAFNINDASPPWSLTKIIAPGAQGTPDGFDWFVNTIHVAATGGDTTPGVHSFAIVGQTYSNRWGGATINVDATTSVPYFSGNTLGPTNSITVEDGFYYSFRILNWRINNDLTIAVMKTSAPPVSLSVSSQTPATPTSNDAVVVSIVTSQPKSTEERIYLRWSTDTYITSHMVEAVGSGVNYSAVIPAQPVGTSVQYCIATSTVDLSQLTASGTIDFLILATTSNTHFAVTPGATPTPTPTATPTATPTPTPTVQVTVQTTPAGRTFSIDGATYSSTQTFSWVAGSSHTIATTSPQNGGTGVQYLWSSWSDAGAISHTLAPTTNKTYTASFTTQYYLAMSHGTGGTISPASGWRNSGAIVSIIATATNNTQVSYSLSGWTGIGTGSYSGPNNPSSITMNGPITENAAFTQNAVQVTVQTNPAGRVFTVDGSSYTAAQSFSWQPGSSHTIATTSPQNDGIGIQRLWSGWSDGGTISHTVAPTTNKTYTATFTTQYYLTIIHGTGGTVNATSGWRNNGAVVSISATPTNNTQVSYSFSGWTGTGTGSYSGTNNPASITMSGPITENAVFTQNPVQVTVQTNPVGRSFTVDGTAYSSMQMFSWTPGSSHTIGTTSAQRGGTGVQYVWKSWSDAGAISHTVAPTTNKRYTATFTTQYYLTMSAGTGGTVSPASGWKNSGAVASIRATPNSGYIFSNWTGSGTGSYTGSTNASSITMGGPISETATFTH